MMHIEKGDCEEGSTTQESEFSNALDKLRLWLRDDASGIERQILTPVADELDRGGPHTLERDPEFIAALSPLLKMAQLYLGAEVRGFENIPRDEPVLIVGNHSGGAFTMDPVPLMVKWIEARGSEVSLYTLSYELLFSIPLIGTMLRRVGCLPASHENARAAIDKGASVVVFPGGDYEVFRPWSERNRVDFGGRMGFIELAIRAGIRVVPMTIHGAHESTLVLTRGRSIARKLGLDKLRVKVFPLVWNLPFGPAPSFVPSMPVPSRVTVQLGTPIDWGHLGFEAADDPEVLQRCYDDITETMQRSMDAMAAEFPYPVLTRINDMRPSRIARRLWRTFSGTASR